MLKSLRFSKHLLAKRDFSTLASFKTESVLNGTAKVFDASQIYASSKPNIDIEERLDSLASSYNKIGTEQTTRSPYQEEEADRSPYELTMEKMLAAGLHLGSATELWNPRNLSFMFGERAGIHIFNLEITMAYLRRACAFTREVAYNGGIILFLSSNPEYAHATISAAQRCGGYYVYHKWIPGTITNREYVLTPELVKNFDGSTKFKIFKPDLLIIANPADNKTAIAEATRKNVPTIALIDSDQDPTSVTYPIPGNDDSVRGIELVMALLSSAAREGIQKREYFFKAKHDSIQAEIREKESQKALGPPPQEEISSLEP